MTKAERLREMERLYFQRAYSDIEMAERLSTPTHKLDRTTIYRDRCEMETELPFAQDEEGRHKIDRSRYLSSIRLNMTEAMSLYLAARRMSQQTRYAHVHTASALEKLALTLRRPMTQRLVKAADQILAQQGDPRRTQVFEKVAQAWVEGLELRLDYRALDSAQTRVHRFRPYLLEPSPWSDSVYLIGHSDLAHGILTLKLERIEQAVLGSAFEVPIDFDDETLLRHAWGIWSSDGKLGTVRLRFAPGTATRRLRESVWHPLERVSPTPDGGCIWEAEIAEWREMLPWIRGWGADCEVQEPAELRVTLMREVKRLNQLYGLRETVSIDDDDDAYDDVRAKTLFRS